MHSNKAQYFASAGVPFFQDERYLDRPGHLASSYMQSIFSKSILSFYSTPSLYFAAKSSFGSGFLFKTSSPLNRVFCLREHSLGYIMQYLILGNYWKFERTTATAPGILQSRIQGHRLLISSTPTTIHSTFSSFLQLLVYQNNQMSNRSHSLKESILLASACLRSSSYSS